MTTQRPTATHTATGGLKHADNCQMAFGRKDPNCPRCQELLAGAAPRALGYTPRDRKAEAEQFDRDWVAHRRVCPICNGSQRGVCTWGDW